MFGPHLTLDLYECDEGIINSQEQIFRVLDELPALIGMHKLIAPQLIPYAGRADSFDKGGISAFILIAESHMSIHTFKAQRHAFVDIFSCKDFDIDKAVAYLSAEFKPKRIEKTLLMRGEHFSKDISATSLVIRQQRKDVQSTARKKGAGSSAKP